MDKLPNLHSLRVQSQFQLKEDQKKLMLKQSKQKTFSNNSYRSYSDRQQQYYFKHFETPLTSIKFSIITPQRQIENVFEQQKYENTKKGLLQETNQKQSPIFFKKEELNFKYIQKKKGLLKFDRFGKKIYNVKQDKQGKVAKNNCKKNYFYEC